MSLRPSRRPQPSRCSQGWGLNEGPSRGICRDTWAGASATVRRRFARRDAPQVQPPVRHKMFRRPRARGSGPTPRPACYREALRAGRSAASEARCGPGLASAAPPRLLPIRGLPDGNRPRIPLPLPPVRPHVGADSRALRAHHRSTGRWSTFMITSCRHWWHWTASDRTPFSRMLESAIGSIGSLKRERAFVTTSPRARR